MPVLLDAMPRARDPYGQSLVAQQRQRLLHDIFVVVHHRFAARFLIAGVHQRVERQRVIFRSRDFFFQQRAQHPNLDRVQRFGKTGPLAGEPILD